MRTVIAALAALAACGPTPKPAPPNPPNEPPPSPLASPPAPVPAAARVIKFSVVTVGRHAGDAETKIEASGKRTGHFTFNDRGRGPDVTTTIIVDASGAPTSYVATGHDYLKAPVDEKLMVEGRQLVWRSTSENGTAAIGAGWFAPLSGPFDSDALMAQALLKAPNHRLKLLPGGEAWIEDDATLEVAVGGKPRKLRRIAIAGIGFAPWLVWLDEQNELFGEVSTWTSVIQVGAESAIDEMVKADQAWKAQRAAKLASTLAHKPPAAGLAFVHASVFDSAKKKLVADQTVIVVGDKITAVGGAKTKVPDGAQVIDATGKTLLPGMFDMHVHLGGSDGVLQLASGITTVRDLGNDVATLAERVKRFDAGTELGPRVLRAGLIDGPGKLAAPTGTLAGTPEEAIAAVKKFKDAGYVQIKIYSSVKPELVPVIADAAHKLGMRVSGHIPNGMNAAQAVEAGYDELQHANFLFLRFLAGPTDDTRTPVRFTKVAEGAADLDLESKDVKAFLDLLVKHKTVLDPTLTAFHGMFVADAGDLDPVLVPYAERLPAQIERGGHNGGLPAPGKREKFRASFAALGKLVKAAWDRKITIVAGTDDTAGLSYPHELELYVAAGIPAREVLALASLGAARVMHVDKDRGSIAVGKQADMVLVDGDPTKDIGAVRNTRAVVCRGVVYDPDELFTAVGMRPRATAATK